MNRLSKEVTHMVEKLVYTVVEAAQLLGISRATAYNLVAQGKLPSVRISERRLIIPKVAIANLLAEASKSATTD